jgi:hypothetical protein
MRAIVQKEYGTADVLRLAEIERPSIGADEVLVEVRAAGGQRLRPIDTILEHAAMDDLLASLVERRVNDLSFKGIRALADYLSDRLAFDLFDSQDDLQRAVRIVEIRNLIAHNRGLSTASSSFAWSTATNPRWANRSSWTSIAS